MRLRIPFCWLTSTTRLNICISSLIGPDGLGGMDIWFTQINEDGSFGPPTNFKMVNTLDDEVTPYYNEALERFFFSSNGLPTIGGFDVFAIQKSEEGWCEDIENLGCPINSSFDDLYFKLDDEGENGVFASNRGNEETDSDFRYCCPDIYRTSYQIKKPLDIIVRTFNKLSRKPLSGVNVELVNMAAPDDLISLVQQIDPANFSYGTIELGQTFRAKGTKSGYRGATAIMSSNFDDCIDPTSLYLDLYLDPIIEIEVRIFDKINNEPMINAGVYLVDTERDKNEVGATAINVSPTDLTNLFSNWEDEEIGFDTIRYNKVYSVSTFHTESGNEFIPDPAFKLIDTDTSKVGTEPITLKVDLFLFEPLPLFFDNAIPRGNYRGENSNRIKKDTIANDHYGTYFDKYVNRRRTFINNSCSGKSNIGKFFDEIEAGKKRLDSLADVIMDRVKDDFKVRLTIEGYASQLGIGEKNVALSHRRTNSLDNYLKKKFIDNNLGNLYTKENVDVFFVPKGAVPDDTCAKLGGGTCCTVFGEKASRDRTVKIRGIRFTPPPGVQDFILQQN